MNDAEDMAASGWMEFALVSGWIRCPILVLVWGRCVLSVRM